MNVMEVAKRMTDAREVLSNYGYHDDDAVLLACDTIGELVGGVEHRLAVELCGRLRDQPPGPVDFLRLEFAVELLAAVSNEARFLRLKGLCVARGTWSIPENPATYNPVWYEVALFGVSATAEDAAELPNHWLQAARRTLNNTTGSAT